MDAVVEGLEPQAATAEDAARDATDAVDAGPGVTPLLAGNRLSLDLYPGGCHRLLHLCAQQPHQLLEVEFLQLSGHEDPQLLEATLARVPGSLPRLRSLVLKGESHLVPARAQLYHYSPYSSTQLPKVKLAESQLLDPAAARWGLPADPSVGVSPGVGHG